LVIINEGETSLDHAADIRINDRAGKVMSQVVKKVKKKMRKKRTKKQDYSLRSE
jgi:NAD-dependent SIR2 family protein deacetylase